MKRKQLVLTVITALMMVLLLTACGGSASAPEGDASVPEKHEIAVAEGYETAQDDLGADAYGGWCDNPDTKYFTINDYYNMASEGSLHILSNFETYQQTTEYTCGPASAHMVINWFDGDIEKYDEMTIAEITGCKPDTGVLAEGIREAGEAERVEASDEKKDEFKQLLESLREMYMYLLVNPGRAYDMTRWCGVMKNAFSEPIDVRRQEVC